MKCALAWAAVCLVVGGSYRISAQTTWPNAPDSNITLLQDVNFLGSNLDGSVTATATTLTVTGSALLGPNQEVFVDFEAVKITAVNGHILTVVRGFDNTVPAAHANNARLYRLPGAALHNFVLTAIFALEKTPFQIVSSQPSGSCTPEFKMEWFPGGAIYGCVGGVWKVIGGGGSGNSQSFTLAFTNQTSIPVPYDLGSNNVIPTVYDATGIVIPGGYTFQLTNDGNNATLLFSTAQSGSITVLTTFTQAFSEAFTNQTAFNVPHGLGTTRPAVSVYSPTGTLLYGETLSPVDANNSNLRFAIPQSGSIVLIRQ